MNMLTEQVLGSEVFIEREFHLKPASSVLVFTEASDKVVQPVAVYG